MKLIYTSLLAFGSLAFFVPSCKKEDAIPAPTADFEIKTANLAVTAVNKSTNGRYFVWDFGDGTKPDSTMAPGHFYQQEGTYTVKLKVEGRDGSIKETSKQVSVTAPPNLVQGGKFEAGDESKWTVLNIASNTNVTVTLANGKAVWAGGSWGHVGIYQAIPVEANKEYQVNMLVSGSGASDTWFEVYVGMAPPVQGQDYNDGGIRLALNTWNGCGTTTFNGPLTALSCGGTGGGKVKFPTSGTAYLVIRSGGNNLGAEGISVDNVELRATK
jgi:hypothetical protein